MSLNSVQTLTWALSRLTANATALYLHMYASIFEFRVTSRDHRFFNLKLGVKRGKGPKTYPGYVLGGPRAPLQRSVVVNRACGSVG